MTKEEFLNRARNTHGYKYKYIDISDKITLRDNIKIKFGDSIYTQNVNKHLSGKCPEKKTPKKTTQEFVEESKKIWGDRFEYNETEYFGSLKKVKFFDKKRGVFIEQIASLHLQGFESKSMNQEEFIEKSKLISDFLYSYEKCYYTNKTSKIKLSCPIHGDFEVNPFLHLNNGMSCKNCEEHEFNKKVFKFLDKHGFNFERQKIFTDCRNIFELPFDFYIPSKRTCIEFDGIQHFQPVDHFGGLKTYEQLKINDKIKNEYCENNYINLIRIKYDQIDRIEEILKNNLLPNSN
jgi:hypothetical protein